MDTATPGSYQLEAEGGFGGSNRCDDPHLWWHLRDQDVDSIEKDPNVSELSIDHYIPGEISR